MSRQRNSSTRRSSGRRASSRTRSSSGWPGVIPKHSRSSAPSVLAATQCQIGVVNSPGRRDDAERYERPDTFRLRHAVEAGSRNHPCADACCGAEYEQADGTREHASNCRTNGHQGNVRRILVRRHNRALAQGAARSSGLDFTCGETRKLLEVARSSASALPARPSVFHRCASSRRCRDCGRTRSRRPGGRRTPGDARTLVGRRGHPGRRRPRSRRSCSSSHLGRSTQGSFLNPLSVLACGGDPSLEELIEKSTSRTTRR
jgi:hypothetical protein